MEKPGDSSESTAAVMKPPNQRTPNPYDPAYWHVIGDSFPTPQTDKHKQKQQKQVVQEKQETISQIRLKLQDIKDAQMRIKEEIICTPVIQAKYVGEKFCKLFFKCENLQNTGSFKARGASNLLLSLPQSDKCRGITTCGGRNYLTAVTHYGHKLSVSINVVVPKDSSMYEKQRYKENFAIVKQYGNDINDANLHALSLCDEIGTKYIHGSDRLDLIAGYGTVGLEVLSQVDRIDAIICPVGSGGLLAGLITAVKTLMPKCAIYGVECTTSPSMTRALQENKPVLVQTKSSIADSLTHHIASNNAFNVIRGYIDRIVTVEESWIARAMLAMVERENMFVEGAAACTVAAILANKVPELAGKNVVCILSGGNINSSRIGRVIERGLAAEGRLVKFTCKLPDIPGAFARLMNRISDMGADVRSFSPEHAWMKRDISTVAVNLLIETTDMTHAKELERRLTKDYPNCNFILVQS